MSDEFLNKYDKSWASLYGLYIKLPPLSIRAYEDVHYQGLGSGANSL